MTIPFQGHDMTLAPPTPARTRGLDVKAHSLKESLCALGSSPLSPFASPLGHSWFSRTQTQDTCHPRVICPVKTKPVRRLSSRPSLFHPFSRPSTDKQAQNWPCWNGGTESEHAGGTPDVSIAKNSPAFCLLQNPWPPVWPSKATQAESQEGWPRLACRGWGSGHIW